LTYKPLVSNIVVDHNKLLVSRILLQNFINFHLFIQRLNNKSKQLWLMMQNLLQKKTA